MHYKNGKEAKVGDRVICKPNHEGSFPVVGVIVQIYPNASSCNAQIVPLTNWQTVNLSDTLHVDDVELYVKETETKDAKSE